MNRGLIDKALNHIAEKLTGVNQVIWGSRSDTSSNNWTSGTISVPKINDYCIFAIRPYGNATWMIAYRTPGDPNLRAIGGNISTTPNQFTFMFSATVSGTTLTYVKCTDINVAGTSHSSHGIATIVGVVPV